MTPEAYLALSTALMAVLAFCTWRTAANVEETARKLASMIRTVQSELDLHVTDQKAVWRQLRFLKRSESRMVKARAQLEIATKACWRMLAKAGGQASGRKRRGEDQSTGEEDNEQSGK